jgi:hypothetical protein
MNQHAPGYVFIKELLNKILTLNVFRHETGFSNSFLHIFRKSKYQVIKVGRFEFGIWYVVGTYDIKQSNYPVYCSGIKVFDNE